MTGRAILSSLAVAVAQLVEPRVVVPVVGGSSPLRHPSRLQSVRAAKAALTSFRRCVRVDLDLRLLGLLLVAAFAELFDDLLREGRQVVGLAAPAEPPGAHDLPPPPPPPP